MTAKMTAAGRARESERADRLFDDPLAAALAGDDGFRWMDEWRLPDTPVENPTIGPRTRFFDDLVVEEVEAGARQVVLVAAGMDTRAFRLALPSRVVVFELDEAPVLTEKQTLLDDAGAEPGCRRVAVSVDLADECWPDSLTAAGFDRSRRAVFIAEGLSFYLAKDENVRLLDHLAALAAVGSRLGLDMVSRDYLENPALAPVFELAAARGARWKFGSNDPTRLLAAHGWCAHVDDFATVGRRYGRWPPPGVSEDAAAHLALGGQTFYISAKRIRS